MENELPSKTQKEDRLLTEKSQLAYATRPGESISQFAPLVLFLGLHLWKEDDISDGIFVRQKHSQSVNPDAEPCRRRHAIFERS